MRDKVSGSSTGSTVTGHSLVRHSKEAVGKMRENK